MTKRFPFLLVWLLTISLLSNSQDKKSTNKKNSLISTIDSILQSQVYGDKIPGAVIQIKQNGKVIYTNAYGYAQKYDFNHQELRSPEKMSVQHLFDIASLTKVVGTTTSIMLLVDRGLLKVDDPVAKYIGGFDDPYKRSITIRHLLTHTAGLYEWYPLYYRCRNKFEAYKLIEELPLKYPVGAGRHYSDLGFIILGEIIEKISGMPLQQFVEQNIFKPLGMEHTTYNPLRSKKFTKIAATGPGNLYENRMVHDSTLGFKIDYIDPDSWNGWRIYVSRGEVDDGNAWYANEGVSGHAGLFSTVGDLQKIVDMLVNKGKVGKTQFISAKTIEMFLSKDEFKNGLGWVMDNTSSYMKNAPAGSFGHTGFTGTSIVAIPSSQTSIILLINRENMGLINGDYYNVGPIRQQIFESVMKN